MPACSEQAALCGKNGWAAARHGFSPPTDTPLLHLSPGHIAGGRSSTTRRPQLGAAGRRVGDRVIVQSLPLIVLAQRQRTPVGGY